MSADYDWPELTDEEVKELRKGRWGFDPAIRRMGTTFEQIRFDHQGDSQ